MTLPAPLYQLGDEVEDDVTHYAGVITSRHEYIAGCVRYGLESMRDGKIDDQVFDESRLVLKKAAGNVGTVDRIQKRLAGRTGGDQAVPPSTRPGE